MRRTRGARKTVFLPNGQSHRVEVTLGEMREGDLVVVARAHEGARVLGVSRRGAERRRVT